MWRQQKMKLDRTLLGAVAVVGLALFAIGSSGFALAQDSGLPMSGENEESISPGDVGLSEEDAVGIATTEANGTVEEVELESEGGTPAYEIELVSADGSETEVTVHADDGTVLEFETEDEYENETEDEYENETEDEYENETEDEYENETEDEYVAPGDVSLSEEDAVGIATAEANGTVEEVELESEGGTPAYEIELVSADGSETEVTVHADDGTVLEFETEDE
jgi:uncharacterized membrane protein YkoI